jgi:hypothetical protein
MPPRVIVAMLVVAGLIALGAWSVVAAVRATRIAPTWRIIGGAGSIVALAVLAAWVLFAWPAYWD